jgi:hypothetical protein
MDDAVAVPNEEQGQPIAICQSRKQPWPSIWPALKPLDWTPVRRGGPGRANCHAEAIREGPRTPAMAAVGIEATSSESAGCGSIEPLRLRAEKNRGTALEPRFCSPQIIAAGSCKARLSTG